MGAFAQPLSAVSIQVISSQTGIDLGLSAYRPSGWNQPATYTLTVPASSQPTPSSVVSDGLGGTLAGAPPMPIVYVFDAILRAENNRSIHMTENPVQTGANITDHSYLNPAKLVLEIKMSDAMDSFTSGQWQGASTKSVNAYQTLVTLMNNRQPVTLGTKLDSYPNMLVEDITAPETKETVKSLTVRVQFRQLILPTVEAVSSTVSFDDDSARPQTTDTTNTGSVQTTPVSASTTSSFAIPSSSQVSVPGAGGWSSNSAAVG